jgi:hypothetical protein
VHELLIIADDLSGAADCGIACASHGLSTLVVLGDTAGEIDTDVLSVDGNTRHLDSAKAAAETARVVRKYSYDEGSCPSRNLIRHCAAMLLLSWWPLWKPSRRCSK